MRFLKSANPEQRINYKLNDPHNVLRNSKVLLTLLVLLLEMYTGWKVGEETTPTDYFLVRYTNVQLYFLQKKVPTCNFDSSSLA